MNEEQSKNYYRILLKRFISGRVIDPSSLAEMWFYENSGYIPNTSTQEWIEMYENWNVLALKIFGIDEEKTANES